MAAAIKFKYVGDRTAGEHLQGVPARDLTAADLAQLTDEQRAAVVASRIYEAADKGKTKELEGRAV